MIGIHLLCQRMKMLMRKVMIRKMKNKMMKMKRMKINKKRKQLKDKLRSHRQSVNLMHNQLRKKFQHLKLMKKSKALKVSKMVLQDKVLHDLLNSYNLPKQNLTFFLKKYFFLRQTIYIKKICLFAL